MIRSAGHMYDGQEAQVAQTLADWVIGVVRTSATRGQ
jgi:hypothetical protein